MLFKRLIHTERQFDNIKKTFLNISSSIKYKNTIKDLPILLILTTQRTGSTVLCHDLEQSCNLKYKPTESFVPPLKYLFNNFPNYKEESFQNKFNDAFSFPTKGPIYIQKLMIDYVGWIGFFLAPKEFVKEASYIDLSNWAIKFILRQSKNNLPIIFLDRTDKFAQASSRLINAMGFKTHLSHESEKKEFKNKVELKLKGLKHPEAMLLDQTSIILKQNYLLNSLYTKLSNEYNTVKINYENDICDLSHNYLNGFLSKNICDTDKISRKLFKTANKASEELIYSTKILLGQKNI